LVTFQVLLNNVSLAAEDEEFQEDKGAGGQAALWIPFLVLEIKTV
jgi:hypothetical protein